MIYFLQTKPKQLSSLMVCWLATLCWGLTDVQAKAKPPIQHLPMERCIADAAQFHRVDPQLLKAILMVESRLNPKAINHNTNGTKDIGAAQVNTVHLPTLEKHGIGEKELKDACVNTYVGAWLLSKQIARHGLTWFGIAAYHSTTPAKNARYQALIYRELMRHRSPDNFSITVPTALR